jgi:hypothetical protein
VRIRRFLSCASGRHDADGRLYRMDEVAVKRGLHRYLQAGRDVLLWKLEGLTDYDMRRPLVPTGTNLLGLVKHLAGIETGYLGSTFGRPFPEPLPFLDDNGDWTEPNADMWVRPE